MMENKLYAFWRRNCALSIALQIIILIVGLGVLFLLVLIASSLPVDRETSFFIFAGMLAAFFLLSVVTVIVWGVITVRRRTRGLDAAFTPLGLDGGSFMLTGRQYQGTLRDRPVDVYFYRGPTLSISIHAALKTRTSISYKSWLGGLVADLAKKEPLAISDARFDPYSIHALDERWTCALLADPQARGALLRLMDGEPSFMLRQVLIQPQMLVLRLQHILKRDITPQNVRTWLDAMFDLLQVAESLPPPHVSVDEATFESKNRRDRNVSVLLMAVITCGLIALMTIAILAIVGILVYLKNVGM
jgi:hypothetical protein